MNLMSNVLGTINPVRQIADAAHAAGALILVDAAQAAPHLSFDVNELDADFLGYSAHKMCGPTGAGVLYAREHLLEEMPPFHGGGEMIREVWADRATWNEIPYKFEAGTPNIAQAVGMGAAVEYLEGLGMDEIRQHEMELTSYAIETDRLDRGGRLRPERCVTPRGSRRRSISTRSIRTTWPRSSTRRASVSGPDITARSP